MTLIGLWSLAMQLAFNSGTMLDYSDPLLALTLGAGGTIALGMWSDAASTTGCATCSPPRRRGGGSRAARR